MTFYYESMTSTVTYGKFFKGKKSFRQPEMLEEFIKDQGVKRKMEILPKMSKIKTGLNLAEFPVIVGS